MKVLLDESMNPRLARYLWQAHEVKHILHLGWGSLADGQLLQKAEAFEYEVLVTTDKQMVKQQNNLSRRVALVVLPANETGWIRFAHQRIVRAVEASTPGSYVELLLEDPTDAHD